MPEFGGFLANTFHANLDRSSNTLLPPTKSISFNQKLTKNDGLLVSHIANEKQLSYDLVLEKLKSISKEWHQKLERGEQLRLENLGVLQLNDEQKILFFPENKTNYLVSSFGLSNITAIPIKREGFKQNIETLEEKVPLKITPEKRKETNLRPWLKYAAIFMLFFSVGASGYLGYKNFGKNQQFLEEQADRQVSDQLQRATFFDANPIELPPLQLNVKKISDGPKYHIIAGAFRSKDNAQRKVGQLKAQGYNASYIGTNSFGLHQVAFATHTDQNEALAQLRDIRESSFPDAWMLAKK